MASTKDDPWADKPDRFDRADRARARADREWEQRWTDKEGEAVEPAPSTYRNEPVTLDRVNDAYGDGMRAAGSHLGTGLQIGASMVFFVGLGIAVDRWLGTSPWGVVVGAVLGMIGVMYLVMRLARQ